MKKHVMGGTVLATALAFCLCVPAFSAETEYEWSIELDCSVCHQKEAASLKAANDPEDEVADSKDEQEQDARVAAISMYGPMHVERFGMTCATCHPDTDGLAKGHKKLNSGKEAKRLKKSEVDMAACKTCHQVEKLAKATADYEGLTDTKGTTVNPHALPAGESHDAILCTDCHQAHSGKTITEAATMTCTSCHHAGVYECGTCH